MADEEAPPDTAAATNVDDTIGGNDEIAKQLDELEGPVSTEEDSVSEESALSGAVKQQASRLPQYRWTLLLLALFLAVLVLGLALPLTLKKSSTASTMSNKNVDEWNDANNSDNPSGNPPFTVSVPSPSSPSNQRVPTIAPAAVLATKPDQWLEALRQVLPDSLYERLITDESSHEFAAYQILLQDDDVTLLSNQRFLITVWDAAMGGNVYRPNVPECSWEGIACDANESINGIQWSDRQLSGLLPDVIPPHLVSLDLGDNQLQSSIPSGWYSGAPQLEYLYLHNNLLTGTISTEIAAWDQLRRLYLGGNQFNGTLPQELGSPGSGGSNARALEYLSLQDNNFRGTLPLNWNLRQLFYLDLGYNELSGSIPTDWVEGIDRMNRLRILYLDHNRFTGSLPPKLGEIGNARLTLLSISDNSFSGKFPTFYNFTKKLNVLELANSGLTDMDKKNCAHSVFESGEMVRLHADCDMCPCKNLCSGDRCSNKL